MPRSQSGASAAWVPSLCGRCDSEQNRRVSVFMELTLHGWGDSKKDNERQVSTRCERWQQGVPGMGVPPGAGGQGALN